MNLCQIVQKVNNLVRNDCHHAFDSRCLSTIILNFIY